MRFLFLPHKVKARVCVRTGTPLCSPMQLCKWGKGLKKQVCSRGARANAVINILRMVSRRPTSFFRRSGEILSVWRLTTTVPRRFEVSGNDDPTSCFPVAEPTGGFRAGCGAEGGKPLQSSRPDWEGVLRDEACNECQNMENLTRRTPETLCTCSLGWFCYYFHMRGLNFKPQKHVLRLNPPHLTLYRQSQMLCSLLPSHWTI